MVCKQWDPACKEVLAATADIKKAILCSLHDGEEVEEDKGMEEKRKAEEGRKKQGKEEVENQ